MDTRTRSAHRFKFHEECARFDRLKLSMVYNSIPQWNRLPAHVAEAGSIDLFKSWLAALSLEQTGHTDVMSHKLSAGFQLELELELELVKMTSQA